MTTTGARTGFDYRWMTLAVTTIGTLMSMLNMSTINIGLPAIMAAFGVDVQEGQWVLTSYMIAMAVAVPLAGFLADKVGSKRLYMMTMALFLVGSMLCTFAWDLSSMILFRVIQGIGGGIMQPLGMAIVFSIITPMERPKFMAMLGLPTLIAPLLGPTLGGYLVEYVSWRGMFSVNLPIGIAGLILAWLLLKEVPPRLGARMDWPGFALSSIAFPSLLLGFSYGARDGWLAPHAALFLFTGTVCLIAWIFVELAQDEPLLDLRLFADRTFSIATFLKFIIHLSLFGTQLLLPLFLQTAQGLTALQAAMILLPQGVASFGSMNIAGRLYNRFGPRPLLLFGLLLTTITTWEMSRIGLDASGAQVTLLALLRGAAIGFCMLPVMTAAFNTVPQEKMGRATGLSHALMRLFGSFSTAFLATVLHARSFHHYTNLASGIAANRPAVAAVQQTLAADMIARGIMSTEAHRRALATVMSRTVSRNALGMAFNDTFLLLTLTGLIGVAASLFLRDKLLERERPLAEEAARAPAASAQPATA